MNLSKQATTELKEILLKDIGPKVENLNVEEIQELGLFLLTVDATYLKVRAQQQT